MLKLNAVLLLSWIVASQSPLAGAEPAPKTARTLRLTPLLGPLSHSNDVTKGTWEGQRKDLKQRWIAVLGPFPRRKPPLKTQVTATEDTPEFTRQRIRYQAEPGLYTEGYLLTPKNIPGKLPAVVVFHPTTPFGARGVAGLEPQYPRDKWQGLDLVRRGYLVWCPNNYINTPGADYAGNAAAVLARHPDWTGMTRMTWDAVRAADFLESWRGVDRKRMACLGHSLGAKVVLYAMAFDQRYCAGVCSEGGIGLDLSNWDAVWYLGAKIRRPQCGLDHHQLLALVAPRPFLLIGGDSADGPRSLAFLDGARPVYELLGARQNLEWFDHHEGHSYGPPAQAAALEFLSRHLGTAR